MDILLDTHAFLWFINGDRSLPRKVETTIKNIDNKCYLSIASIWEIAIKVSLNKLHLKSDFSNITSFLTNNQIELLPITFGHIECLLKQKFYHKDPFDRIIISQAYVEKLNIITKDFNFKNYPIKIMWE